MKMCAEAKQPVLRMCPAAVGLPKRVHPRGRRGNYEYPAGRGAEEKAIERTGRKRYDGGQHYPENAPGEEGRIEMSTRMVAAAIRTAGESETAGALGDALLARELERTREELKRVTAERDLLAWGIREGNRRKAEELEKRMEEKARRKNRWKRVAALFVIREED